MTDYTDFIDAYLDTLKQRERSSPAGKYWDRVFRMITENLPPDEMPPNPLILGGSIASDANKHACLREHLIVAAKRDCLFEVISMMEKFPTRAWNTAPIESWNNNWNSPML
jgi:hypothetical protein